RSDTIRVGLDNRMRAGFALSAAMLTALSAGALTLVGIAPSAEKTPMAALAAARQAGLTDKPVFNEYNFGGFLIFNRVPTFIDGRADMFGDAFVDRTLTAASNALAKPGLPDLLQEHGVQWTLLYRDDVSAALLDRDPGWKRLYQDDIAVIHVPIGASSLVEAKREGTRTE
ncbi:MAG: hypothetical protein AAGF59_12480, partial [Pseudomonadota bacterium]